MLEPGLLRRPSGGLPEDEGSDNDMARGPDSGAAFRISVDLSEYFQQSASFFMWMPQPRESRTVRWLARRVRRTAALRERFCLLCADHALPPDEPLRLLRPGDALRVVRVEHEWQRVFSFRGERLPPASPPKPKKRRKTDAVEAESTPASTPNPKPSFPPPDTIPEGKIPQLSTPPSVVLVPPLQLTIPPSSVSTVLPVLPSTSPPLDTVKPPSQDEELQRLKRRALALLQKVEGNISGRSLEEGNREVGNDEPDCASEEWPPAKKRRRRVRRRRPLPPIDFELELALAIQSPTQATSELQASPDLSQTYVPSTPELSLTSAVSTTPVSSIPAPPPPIPAASILAPPSISVPPLSLVPPSGPVELRGAATPRPPRLVRALDATSSDVVAQSSNEHSPSAAPSLLPQVVQCS